MKKLALTIWSLGWVFPRDGHQSDWPPILFQSVLSRRLGQVAVESHEDPEM